MNAQSIDIVEYVFNLVIMRMNCGLDWKMPAFHAHLSPPSGNINKEQRNPFKRKII
jgi:hypothetical protein